MSWQFRDNEPVFVQIGKRLRAEIVNGKYQLGSQIPPVRKLAFEAAVNPNTVQRALFMLEQDGLIEARGTVGIFVTSDSSAIIAAKERMKREAVKGWIREAKELGICKEEFVAYLSMEDLNDE